MCSSRPKANVGYIAKQSSFFRVNVVAIRGAVKGGQGGYPPPLLLIFETLKTAFTTSAQLRFASVVIDGFPRTSAPNSPCFSVFLEVTYKAIQGTEMETRGDGRNGREYCFPNEGSLIFLYGKSLFATVWPP